MCLAQPKKPICFIASAAVLPVFWAGYLPVPCKNAFSQNVNK